MSGTANDNEIGGIGRPAAVPAQTPETEERVAVIGLGYVGLPVACAFARAFPGTQGFDINPLKVHALQLGRDPSGQIPPDTLRSCGLTVTAHAPDLTGASFFVIAVPTPVDANHQPDLSPLQNACRTVGPLLQPGACVVFESTVYPGVTEQVCGPLLQATSGLQCGRDFTLGYSPERINPGDPDHTLERIPKIVSGQDPETLDRVARAYQQIVTEAPLHRAPSIMVAEAAKVIENTQRDLNIALMNELALIFDRLGIRTQDVLAAARTKWNFLPFTPGLVGGHCIGVDPYYLTRKAEEVGYHPEVILAGRRINDGMGAFLAQRLVKLLIEAGREVRGARVGILGLTFKEDVGDIRNSRVPDIVRELGTFGVEAVVHDPLAERGEAFREYGIGLVEWEALEGVEGVVVAVSHRMYREVGTEGVVGLVKRGGVVMDVKGMLDRTRVPDHLLYWSL